VATFGGVAVDARIREGFTDASILTADEEAALEEATELALDADEARFIPVFLAFPLAFGLALGLDFFDEEALFEEAALALLLEATLALRLGVAFTVGLGDETRFTTLAAGIFIFYRRSFFFLFLYIGVSKTLKFYFFICVYKKWRHG